MLCCVCVCVCVCFFFPPSLFSSPYSRSYIFVLFQFEPTRQSYVGTPATYSVTFDEAGFASKITVSEARCGALDTPILLNGIVWSRETIRKR